MKHIMESVKTTTSMGKENTVVLGKKINYLIRENEANEYGTLIGTYHLKGIGSHDWIITRRAHAYLGL